MTMTGSCHCGAVRVVVPARPEWLAVCNCSLCRKTGNVMAYYPDDGPEDSKVRIEGDTATYIWGDKMIAHHHCPTCACRTHWKLLAEDVRGTSEQEARGESYSKIGVNARLLDGFAVREREGEGGEIEYAIAGEAVAVRFLDNA